MPQSVHLSATTSTLHDQQIGSPFASMSGASSLLGAATSSFSLSSPSISYSTPHFGHFVSLAGIAKPQSSQATVSISGSGSGSGSAGGGSSSFRRRVRWTGGAGAATGAAG